MRVIQKLIYVCVLLASVSSYSIEANSTEIKNFSVQVNQIELQVKVYPNNGETIVFLHSFGNNLRMWDAIIPYFKDRYHIVLVDLRGHGKSTKAKSGYHIDEMAKDVLGVMQHLKLEPSHIIGSSMGAMVGLSLGANYPESVRSLILESDMISNYGAFSLNNRSDDEYEADKKATLTGIGYRVVKTFPSVDVIVEHTWSKDEVRNSAMEAVIRHGVYEISEGQYTTEPSNTLLGAFVSNTLKYRYEDYFSKITNPLIVLGGEKDFPGKKVKFAQKKLINLAEQGG